MLKMGSKDCIGVFWIESEMGDMCENSGTGPVNSTCEEQVK